MNNKKSYLYYVKNTTLYFIIAIPIGAILWGIGIGIYKFLSFLGMADPYPAMIITVIAFILFYSFLQWVSEYDV